VWAAASPGLPWVNNGCDGGVGCDNDKGLRRRVGSVVQALVTPVGPCLDDSVTPNAKVQR